MCQTCVLLSMSYDVSRMPLCAYYAKHIVAIPYSTPKPCPTLYRTSLHLRLSLHVPRLFRSLHYAECTLEIGLGDQAPTKRNDSSMQPCRLRDHGRCPQLSMRTVDYTYSKLYSCRNPRLSVSRAVQIVEHHLIGCGATCFCTVRRQG